MADGGKLRFIGLKKATQGVPENLYPICLQIESTALFDKILGVYEENFKCAVCNGEQVGTSSVHILKIFKSGPSEGGLEGLQSPPPK